MIRIYRIFGTQISDSIPWNLLWFSITPYYVHGNSFIGIFIGLPFLLYIVLEQTWRRFFRFLHLLFVYRQDRELREMLNFSFMRYNLSDKLFISADIVAVQRNNCHWGTFGLQFCACFSLWSNFRSQYEGDMNWETVYFYYRKQWDHSHISDTIDVRTGGKES